VETSAARILVVDDEKQIRRILAASLASRGNEVVEAASGGEAVSRTALHQPDLIILDLGLPDIDGIEVIRRVREFTQTPIIILSVREGEEDKIEALNAGADDYVTKPFAMGELLARVRVALRRASREEDEGAIVHGDMTVDLGRHLIIVRGQKVRLSVTEYEILRHLALHRGKVVTHGQLLHVVRGPNHQEDSHYIRVYIAQLRHKIESDPNNPTHIITEPGVGYRMANGD
jgi:two-component system KDP operon response regulator KdpE